MDKQLDIITTSLEALLQRGTNPKNVGRDGAAIDAFCGLVKKEPECIPTAAKLIVSKMQSMQEWEALQALQLLEACMHQCGPQFQAEVGKFRFLNELIKLISPKYLGSLTPDSVRTEIVELLYLWTLEYPKETKIREAYEMLKKQRVVQADPTVSGRRAAPPPTPTSSLNQSASSMKPLPPRSSGGACSILEDENSSKLLQKLLQSKKPEDLQKANKLIKSMVSEEERKMEQRAKVTLEMEGITNSASLLTEMLDHYSRDNSDYGDWDLIRELHETCEGYRSHLVSLAQHLPSGDDDLFQMVISTNECLNEAQAKYMTILNSMNSVQTNTPLLDMSSARPSPQHVTSTAASHLNDLVDLIPQESPPASASFPSTAPPSTNNNVDLLNDLLSNSSSDSQLLSLTPQTTSNQLGGSSSQNSLQVFENQTQQISDSQNPLSSHTVQVSSATNAFPETSNVLSPSLTSTMPSANSTLGFPTLSATNDLLNTTALSTSSDLLNPPVSSNPSGLLLTTKNSHQSNTSNDLDLISNSSLLNLNASSSSNIIDLTSPCPVNPNSRTSSQTPSSFNSIPQSQRFSVPQGAAGVNSQQLEQNASSAPSGHSQQLQSRTTGQLQSPTASNKLKALKDLDDMVGESLNRLGLNEDGVAQKSKPNGVVSEASNFYGVEARTNVGEASNMYGIGCNGEDDEQLLLDDFMVEETNGHVALESRETGKKAQEPALCAAINQPNNNPTPTLQKPCDIKLSDINIALEDIVPSNAESIRAMDEVNSVTILIHLTRTRPKPNVAVFVVTTLSKHKTPLSGYLFQPVVPKGYKLRQQPPSSTSLPAFNPFLPSPAITQIMLIACPPPVQDVPPLQSTPTGIIATENLEGTAQNPSNTANAPLSNGQNVAMRGESPKNGSSSHVAYCSICLKFVVSYEVEGEAVSEMGEIAELPLSET